MAHGSARTITSSLTTESADPMLTTIVAELKLTTLGLLHSKDMSPWVHPKSCSVLPNRGTLTAGDCRVVRHQVLRGLALCHHDSATTTVATTTTTTISRSTIQARAVGARAVGGVRSGKPLQIIISTQGSLKVVVALALGFRR